MLFICDPPYTHSQGIIYGAQTFNIEVLFNKIAECKAKCVYVMLSINGTRRIQQKGYFYHTSRRLIQKRNLRKLRNFND